MRHSSRNDDIPAFWFELMLLLMAGIAGSVDVLSYYGLGHVFTANMTGNTIVLGLSLGQGKFATSLHALTALAGFFAGAFAGSLIVENNNKNWKFFIRLSVSVEGILIVVFAAIWYFLLKNNTGFILYLSIILPAVAMGMQSATIRYLNIPGIVTTFLTGTITSIGLSAVKGLRNGFKKKENQNSALPVPKTLNQRIGLQLLVFITYFATAVFTGWLTRLHETILPLVPIAFLFAVISILFIFLRRK